MFDSDNDGDGETRFSHRVDVDGWVWEDRRERAIHIAIGAMLADADEVTITRISDNDEE